KASSAPASSGSATCVATSTSTSVSRAPTGAPEHGRTPRALLLLHDERAVAAQAGVGLVAAVAVLRAAVALGRAGDGDAALARRAGAAAAVDPGLAVRPVALARREDGEGTDVSALELLTREDEGRVA